MKQFQAHYQLVNFECIILFQPQFCRKYIPILFCYRGSTCQFLAPAFKFGA